MKDRFGVVRADFRSVARPVIPGGALGGALPLIDGPLTVHPPSGHRRPPLSVKGRRRCSRRTPRRDPPQARSTLTWGGGVEAKGLEPSNLLTASQALYQLSYAPEVVSHYQHSAGRRPEPGEAVDLDRLLVDRLSGSDTRAVLTAPGLAPGTIIGNGTGLRRHRYREEMAAPLGG